MSLTAELWTNWQCASGVALGTLQVVAGSFTEQLDGTDQCELTVVQDARVTPLQGYVVRLTDAGGTVREYRIVTREQTIGLPTWRLKGTSPLADLATAGLVRGGTGVFVGFNVTTTQTPATAITLLVLTNLAADGLSWLSLGTIEPTEVFTVGVPDGTRLDVLRQIEQLTRSNLVLRRVGSTGYAIDLLSRRGSTAPTLPLAQAKQVTALSVVDDDSKSVTVVVPTAPTTPNVSTVVQNAWALGTPIGAGPFWIPLTDPAGGAAPIAFDGQCAGLWLLRADGGHTQITTSRASDSAVQVASLTGLTTGQHVSIVRDNTGGRVIELARPAVARIVVRDSVEGLRGERNYIRDPLITTWTNDTTPAAWGGSASVRRYNRDTTTTLTATATASGTDTLITAGPAGFVFFRGDRLIIGGVDTYTVMSAAVTLDGSGAGTIEVTDGSGSLVGATGAVSLSTAFRSRPAAWPDDGVASNAPVMLFQTRNVFGLGDVVPWPPTDGTATWARTSESINVAADDAAVMAAAAWTICTPGGVTVSPGDTELYLPGIMLYRNGVVAAHERVPTIATAGTFHQVVQCGALHASASSVQLFAYGGVSAQNYLRWGSIYLAGSVSVPPPPIRHGSHANRLWQRGNRLLTAYQDARRSISLSLRDLSRAAGYSVTREQLVLGGAIDVQDLGFTSRVVGLTWSALDPADVQVTLDSRPVRLIRFLSEAV